MQTYNTILLTNNEVQAVVTALEAQIAKAINIDSPVGAKYLRNLADEILVQSLNRANDDKGGAV